jgi:tetratricopeptide (TPR) repeat protein
VTACDDGAARLWDTASGTLVGTPLTHHGPVRAATFSADGKTVATGGDDGTVHTWDAFTLTVLGKPLSSHAAVVQLAYGGDGESLRAWLMGYRLRVWDVAEVPNDFGRVENWVQALTGLVVDSQGTIRVLDWDRWAKIKARLGNQAWLDVPGMDVAPPVHDRAWESANPAMGYRTRAQQLRSEGKNKEEVLELQKAVELDPHDEQGHAELARALREAGRLDEALAQCREALRLQPRYGWAHQVLGWILLGKGDWDGAIAEYQQAGTPDPAREHEMGLAFLGKNRLDDALAHFRAAIGRDRNYEPARADLAAALYDAGRIDELVEEFRAAIGRDRADAMAHVYYCRALIWAGRPDEAAGASKEAVRIMPAFGPAWQVHAWCFLSGRDWDAAISAYRQAIRHGPDNGSARNELGIALRGRGHLVEALREFERAVELAPGAPEFARELAVTKRHQVLAPRLPAVLRGDDRPQQATEWLDFAYVCENRRLYAAAARMFAEAFKADPALTLDNKGRHRYNAACNAALAASGKGDDNPAPDENARVGLRSFALGWLGAELATWDNLLRAKPASDRASIVKALAHWRHDPDLAGLRTPGLVAALPASERSACEAFWAKVDALQSRAKQAAQ